MLRGVYKTNMVNGRWASAEHARYLRALDQGLSWRDIAKRVGTRTEAQCRSHHQKMRLRKKKGLGERRVEPIFSVDQSTQWEPQHSLPETGTDSDDLGFLEF